MYGFGTVRLPVPFGLADQHRRVVEGRATDLNGEVVPEALGFERHIAILSVQLVAQTGGSAR